MENLSYLMSDLGMSKRFSQMKLDEQGERVTLERLKILTGRVRKILRARKDLNYILGTIL